MKLAKVQLASGKQRVGILHDAEVQLLDLDSGSEFKTLADILNSDDAISAAHALVNVDSTTESLDNVQLLAPIDTQEVWAAGVTYKRSQVARMEESEAGASHYDMVYTADRPEIFLKATPNRVSGPGEPVRVRSDSNWTVPEPELTLVVRPDLQLVGFTVGNDMSARDIEGENPLYLPQAKVYNQCCGLGPCILLAEEPLDRPNTKIILAIDRGGSEVFRGETNIDQMARGFEDLIGWLGKENTLPNGAFLLTGTGIVPPDEFTLQNADSVSIEITGIGTLTNPVIKD